MSNEYNYTNKIDTIACPLQRKLQEKVTMDSTGLKIAVRNEMANDSNRSHHSMSRSRENENKSSESKVGALFYSNSYNAA